MTTATLYIVSTPIGNLNDMTPRAVETLKAVHLIAAEDTRHSARLLQHFGIKTPMWACHDHNERSQADRILQRLQNGEQIALISDAGTPLISDPGFHLVRTVREAGIDVVPVPGACAMVAALSAAGLATDRFIFEGFLPAKAKAKRDRLADALEETKTVVYYESPHRIVNTLETMIEVFGADRYLVMARELTKTFETIHGDHLGALLNWMKADANQQKGEFVLLLEGVEPIVGAEFDADTRHILETLLSELSVKQAAALAAKITGIKRKVLYQAALDMKQLNMKQDEA